ncbi:hypothetical protein GCM10017600_84690 [Streptosporangium carneum]|uniref:Uncharacterized protein n=1 Tax=Streptosporangium carneum TaxID=47481 RepID=A0A9W6MI77_9ACTN|nr:hypothetical protein GCM10017600_84690 [Streptosporangium carneum]
MAWIAVDEKPGEEPGVALAGVAGEGGGGARAGPGFLGAVRGKLWTPLRNAGKR